jgi:hypothetical protein
MKEHWTVEGEHCCELELVWEAFLESARGFSGLTYLLAGCFIFEHRGHKDSFTNCIVHRAASLI